MSAHAVHSEGKTSKKPMKLIGWTNVTRAEGCRYHRRGTVVERRGTFTIDVCVPTEAGPWLTIQFTNITRLPRRQDTCRYESLSDAMTDTQMSCVVIRYYRFPAMVIYQIRELLERDARHIDQAMLDQARAEEQVSRENLRRDAYSKDLAATVPDGQTDFAKPSRLSRSGRGGVRTAHFARTRRTKGTKGTKRTKKKPR